VLQDAHPVLGEVAAQVYVTLSHSWDSPITVHFETEDATAIGDPNGAGDYVPVDTDVTIAPGLLKKTVTIEVDSPYDTITLDTSLSSYFTTKISDANEGATIADGEGIVTLAQPGMVIETPLATQLGESDMIPDFNGDGLTDLFLGGLGGQAAVLLTPGTVFEESGHIVVDEAYLETVDGFSFHVDSTAASGPYAYQAVDYVFGDHSQSSDFNDDGLSDVLVLGESRMNVLYGSTDSIESFEPGDARLDDGIHGTEMADLEVSYFAHSVQTGDWNADGRMDFAQAHWYSSSYPTSSDLFTGYYGEAPPLGGSYSATETFSFTSGTSAVGTGSLVSGCSTGGRVDLNDDGINDVVYVGLASNDGAFGGNYLFARFGDGTTLTGEGIEVKGTLDGTNGFQVANDSFPSNKSSFRPQDSGDVNGDGVEDLVLTGGGTNHSLAVIFGKATPFASGTYATLDAMGDEAAFFNTDAVLSARLGDLNRDGIDDIVFITENKLRVVWGMQDLQGKDIFGTVYPEVGEIDIDPESGLDRVAVVGDLDGDDTADIVMLSSTWEGDRNGAVILFGKTITRFLGGPRLDNPA